METLGYIFYGIVFGAVIGTKWPIETGNISAWFIFALLVIGTFVIAKEENKKRKNIINKHE